MGEQFLGIEDSSWRRTPDTPPPKMHLECPWCRRDWGRLRLLYADGTPATGSCGMHGDEYPKLVLVPDSDGGDDASA